MLFSVPFCHRDCCNWFHGRRFFQERHRRHRLVFHYWRFYVRINHFTTGLRRCWHFNHRSKGSFKVAFRIALCVALNGRLHHHRFQLSHDFLGLDFLKKDRLRHGRLGFLRLERGRSIHNRLCCHLWRHLQNTGSNGHVGSEFGGKISGSAQHVCPFADFKLYFQISRGQIGLVPGRATSTL